METTSCIIQDSERLKQDAIDKAHIESMSDYIKIPKLHSLIILFIFNCYLKLLLSLFYNNEIYRFLRYTSFDLIIQFSVNASNAKIDD